MQKIFRLLLKLAAVLAIVYLLLLIPDRTLKPIMKTPGTPFAWNQDSVWTAMENQFVAAREKHPDSVKATADTLFNRLASFINLIDTSRLHATDSRFDALLNTYFQLSAIIAAHPQEKRSLLNIYRTVRLLVKQQSIQWDMNDRLVRDRLYKLLYGMRAATEEVLLQLPGNTFNPIINGTQEASATPSATIAGITVHSGDLLVSRGGAEVSALISRGNNYPGNFSHVALLYVDAATNQPYFIEAHIEKGVAIATAEQYLKDKKLRFMVLRPNEDLPQLKADPQLPHKAAKLAYDAALGRHIPYDFKMNFHDSTEMFCSEVGSWAYAQQGIPLWKGISSISSPGVVNWLSAFGVQNFVTQMPSDLEYDPQLTVVAEYRDTGTLMKDHIDNAVMDALLEQADSGRTIAYNHWQLPLVRVVKGWCIIKNWFGGVGIIPEGMSATQALKNQDFVSMYTRVKTGTTNGLLKFVAENRYAPPYWQLVAIAKKAAGEDKSLQK